LFFVLIENRKKGEDFSIDIGHFLPPSSTEGYINEGTLSTFYQMEVHILAIFV